MSRIFTSTVALQHTLFMHTHIHAHTYPCTHGCACVYRDARMYVHGEARVCMDARAGMDARVRAWECVYMHEDYACACERDIPGPVSGPSTEHP